MKYEDYSVSELAADESFIRWVKQSDQSDQLFWDHWLLHHSDRRSTVEEARQMVMLIQFRQDPDTPQRVDALWEKIQQTNQASAQSAARKNFRSLWQKVGSWRTWQKMAAVFGGTLVLFTAVYLTLFTNRYIEYQTTDGETKEIQLPDGSTVTLNANSSLRMTHNWDEDREVWMKGEAFFSVKKKPVLQASFKGRLAKFTVHTTWVHVQVLGTEFNVSERRQNTMVVLQSGKIQLSLPSEKKQFVMQPGDLIAFSDKAHTLTQKKVNPEIYSAWTQHEWILDHLSLADMAAKIEETYGVSVVIKHAKNNGAVVDGVVPTDNLENLLKALSAAFDVKITQIDNQILIE